MLKAERMPGLGGRLHLAALLQPCHAAPAVHPSAPTRHHTTPIPPPFRERPTLVGKSAVKASAQQKRKSQHTQQTQRRQQQKGGGGGAGKKPRRQHAAQVVSKGGSYNLA